MEVVLCLLLGVPTASSIFTEYAFGKNIKDITIKIENNIYEGIGCLTLMKFAIFGFVVLLFILHFCVKKRLRNDSIEL